MKATVNKLQKLGESLKFEIEEEHKTLDRDEFIDSLDDMAHTAKIVIEKHHVMEHARFGRRPKGISEEVAYRCEFLLDGLEDGVVHLKDQDGDVEEVAQFLIRLCVELLECLPEVDDQEEEEVAAPEGWICLEGTGERLRPATRWEAEASSSCRELGRETGLDDKGVFASTHPNDYGLWIYVEPPAMQKNDGY